LDHVGAEVGENLPGERPRHAGADLHHGDPAERQRRGHGDGSSATCFGGLADRGAADSVGSPPPCGEGWGVGAGVGAPAHTTTPPPLPPPPPQGGREQTEFVAPGLVNMSETYATASSATPPHRAPMHDRARPARPADPVPAIARTVRAPA